MQMKNDGFQVGLLGAGWWAAEAHLPAIAGHPRARIAAIQTRSAEKAAKLLAQFDIGVAVTTAEELLALPGLDAVIISSTPQVHYAQAKAALERGLHVLIEKPMTLGAAESAELLALAEEKGVQFLISCPWHYTRHGVLARERIAAGALGDIRLVNIFMTNVTLGFYEAKPFAEALAGCDGVDASATPLIEPQITSYSDPATAGGGHIYCQASHIFAYLGFLTGLEPREISARFDDGGTAVDATNVVHITMAGGALVSLGTIATHADVDRYFEVRIVGTKGILALELWKGTFRLRLSNGEEEEPSPLTAEEIYPKFDPAINFVDAALGLAPNRSPASLGHYAMRLIEASCQSAAQGRPIKLG